MGNCKDEMKPTTDKGKSILGMIRGRKKQTVEQKAQTFGDKLADLEDTLNSLIIKKEAELVNESGRETYNQKALAILKAMQFHLDSVIDHAETYQNLN